MAGRIFVVAVSLAVIVIVAGCGSKHTEMTELKSFPLDDLDMLMEDDDLDD